MVILRDSRLRVKPPPARPSQALNALDVVRDWQEEGWRPGVPAGVRRDYARIDASVCAEMVCPCCGGGMAYWPFHKGGAYRVLAVCECGAAEEY